MRYKVLFKKRRNDEPYILGVFENEATANLVAQGEYHYRGGMTGSYEISKSFYNPEPIPEYLYPILLQTYSFLSTEEQEVFRDHHINYLKRKGLIPQWS